MDIIIDIITNGIETVPDFILPEPTNSDEGFSNARDLLIANSEFIKNEIIEYIGISYPPFVYDKDKCGRDTGIILDGVYYDIALGTNYNSVVNGRSYLRSMASEVINSQLRETVGAIKFIKLETQTVLGNELISVTRNIEAFGEIVDIIENGEEAANVLEWSDPGINANKRHAREQLQINKDFIQEELIEWITANYPLVEYDQTLCRRDIGYIIDAVSYDIQYGGNSATIEAAKAYFYGVASVLPEEEREITELAYRQLATILSSIVLETYTNQDILGNPATQTEADQIELLIEIVADVIQDDNLDSLPTVVNPNLVWVDKKIRDAISNITTAKSSIIESTLAYIDNTYGFVYNEETCARDVGYIIDALRYDLTYSGNTEILNAARAYYSKNNLQIPIKQKLITAAAYRYLKSLVEIISINNTVGAVPTINFISPAGVTAAKENAVELIQQNKAFISAEMTKFIEINFQTFTYDSNLCSRDIGLVIDAVIYDLVFNSNFKIIKAAMSYYRAQASIAIGAQKLATTKSFEYLKQLLVSAVSNNEVAVQRISNGMDILLDILENGLDVIPVFQLPEPDTLTTGFKNAKSSIELNYDFIKAEVVAYISNNYPSLVYDQSICQRDVEYILDAVVYDILYGGNTETVAAAKAYYSGNMLQIPLDEKQATLETYDFLRSLLIDIVLGNTVVPLQTEVSQAFGTAGSLTESNYVNNLLVDLTAIINDIEFIVVIINPDISWTPLLLQDLFYDLQGEKSNIQDSVINWINDNFVNFTYNEEICQRDLEYILNAISYDILYTGNSQTADAADEYYSGGILRIPGETLQTVAAFNFVNTITQQVILNQSVDNLQTEISQIISPTPSSPEEAENLNILFNIVTNIIENAYSSIITLEEFAPTINDNTEVTFHQYSLITASGHTFEWIGAGTNVNTALPYLGGTPITENQVIEINGGKVYFTGTDQKGDFRIGNDFVINQNTGTISGRTFTKSLFAVITPYILAIGE